MYTYLLITQLWQRSTLAARNRIPLLVVLVHTWLYKSAATLISTPLEPRTHSTRIIEPCRLSFLTLFNAGLSGVQSFGKISRDLC